MQQSEKVTFNQILFTTIKSVSTPHIFTKTKHSLSYIHEHLAENVTIPDTRWNYDMPSDITIFESITMFKCKGNNTPVVKLGDDDTMLCVKRYGYMDYKIMEK